MATVLLIDPDDDHRLNVRNVLYLAGCHLLEAGTLQHAQAVALAERPELIVMDLFLPGRAGHMFIREMKKDLPNTKIIAMSESTGTEENDDHRLALDCGAAATLTKPVAQIDLISLVHDLLGDT